VQLHELLTKGAELVSKSKDDEERDRILAELKEARKKAEEAKPVERAGKSAVVKQAFEERHGRGKKNGGS
jgi:hypothetical protein